MRLVVSWVNCLSCLSLVFFTLTIYKDALAQAKPQFVDIQKYEDLPRLCPDDLPTAIEKIINRPELARSRWGIEVQTDRAETLYSLNGNKFFTPASSAKLLTTAAIISQLGADYRIETPIFSVGNPPNLTSLRLKGQGDPSISTKSLKTIVHQLQALGVKRIEKLIIDDSYFEPPTINPTWEWLDVHSYFATAVNSTILNQNTVTLTLLPQQIGQPVKFYWNDKTGGRQWQVINQAVTGKADIPYNIEIDGDLGKPVLQIRGELGVNEPPDVWDLAVVDPADYFLESFRLHLAQAGITVTRGIVVEEADRDNAETKLLTVSSPSIAEIIQEINQESNNLYAEAIAKVLAKQLNTKTAIEAIEQSLIQLGINSEEYVLVDASGLSRQNLVTPQILVKTLELMSKISQPNSNVYRQSLAVAGTNGTLKNRFKNTAIRGLFLGKTGTLTGVATLTGYLFTPNYSTIVVSIIVNNSELSSNNLRQAIDEIILLLNHLSEC